MTATLAEIMSGALSSRLCVVGVGNVDRGDDGAGVRLAEALADAGVPDVVVAGTEPERFMEILASSRFEAVLFLDAAAGGMEAGSVVFLDARQIEARYPQVSTHKISLGTLSRLIAARSGAASWLLGVAPATIAERDGLTADVEETVGALASILIETLPKIRGRKEGAAA